jgi:predicted enzyme related to lactoylglutathione lyase
VSVESRIGWPNWIGIVVEDLGAQRRFWGHVLGLGEMAEGPDYVQFDMGDGRVLELLQRSDAPQYDRRRFQVGFAVDDIQRAHEVMREKGATPISEIVAAGESSWAYFVDPEGNVFEITQRPA